MLSEENELLGTTKDTDDWHAAIDEYFELQENHPALDENELRWDLLKTELDSCIIALGYALSVGYNPNGIRRSSSSAYFMVDDYVLLCATKSIKTLRAIKLLISEEVGADCFPLARHIYENYLHIAYIIARPDMLAHIIDAPLGLKLGTHEYAKNRRGEDDTRIIIRKIDGTRFQGHISKFEMARTSNHKCDEELFRYIYDFLSEYTHPTFTSLKLVMNDKGNLDPLTNELQAEALLYSIAFTCFILIEVANLNIINQRAKQDLRTVSKRSTLKIIDIFKHSIEQLQESPHIRTLMARLDLVIRQQYDIKHAPQ